jgi:hypothetical protein
VKTTSFVSQDDETGEYKWTLPADVYEVKLIDTQYFDEYRVDDTNMYLSFLGDDVTKIRIEYVKVPNSVAADADVSNIPIVFHPAMLARVIEKWYAIGGNQAAAQYHRDIWNKGINKAKKFFYTRPWRNLSATSTGSSSTATVKNIHGKLSILDGVNTVTIGSPGTPVTMSDTDYTVMLNGNGIWVTAVNPTTSLMERTTTTFNVWSAGDNVNFEYIVQGI